MTYDELETLAAESLSPAPSPCEDETPVPLIYLSDDELLAAFADMRRLVARAGICYGTSAADIDFIARIALADPEAALRCLLATARTQGIH